MTVLKDRIAWVAKVAKWYSQVDIAVTQAGGATPHIVDKIPDDVLYTLIANNLYLTYKGDN